MCIRDRLRNDSRNVRKLYVSENIIFFVHSFTHSYSIIHISLSHHLHNSPVTTLFHINTGTNRNHFLLCIVRSCQCTTWQTGWTFWEWHGNSESRETELADWIRMFQVRENNRDLDQVFKTVRSIDQDKKCNISDARWCVQCVERARSKYSRNKSSWSHT